MTLSKKKISAGRILVIVSLLLIFAVLLHRFWPTGEPALPPSGRGGQTGVATLVHSAQVTVADVPVYLTGLGTVTPEAMVTVTSRVDGELLKVLFTEGQKVTVGQLLAQIDPRSYQATLAQYQGTLAENQALLKSAELTLARYQKLYAQDSLSRQDLESQLAMTGQYRGTINAVLAQIEAAKLELDYTRITSPIKGRAGLRLVDAGNMVHSSDTTGIVTITQMQPAAVTFSLPQRYIPQLVKALHQGQSLPAIVYDQDNAHPLAQGEVRFISNEIDTATGSIELKATFANQDDALYPNQLVNLRLQIDTLKQVTVIPSQALQLSSDGSFVWVIEPDNRVRRVAVTAGPGVAGDQQAIISGLRAGERVVTEGIDRLKKESKVRVVTAPQDNQADGSAKG